jgi:hypothetical protein
MHARLLRVVPAQCTGCGWCEDAAAIVEWPWTVQDNVKCGIAHEGSGTVGVGDHGASFDIMQIALCLDVCESAPECGGIWCG